MAGKSVQSGRLSARVNASASALKRMVSSDLVREIWALALLLAVAFVVLSIVSHNEADYAEAVWQSDADPQNPTNLGGRFGASLVGTGFLYFGHATNLLVALAGIFSATVFIRRKVENWPVKMAGAALAVVCFAGFFGGSLNGSATMPTGGGIVGANVYNLLSTNFGVTGAFLILSVISIIAFLLASDLLLYPMLRDFLFGKQIDEEVDASDLEIVFEKSDPDVSFQPDGSQILEEIASESGQRQSGVLAKLAGFFGIGDRGDESARLAFDGGELASTSTALVQPQALLDDDDGEDPESIVEDVSEMAAAAPAAKPKKKAKKAKKAK
ncbi:MAG: DNA translocase FtsK 4TM domain-containing protein, partial [Planctomycetes bacterium]|nr:DNA translocase FtsK 4TM domain-containing protein [Planctomycetota bacterium]